VRLLVDHREDLVGERTRIINRLRWHLHELDLGEEPASRALNRLRNLDKLAARLAIAEGTVARIARRALQEQGRLRTPQRHRAAAGLVLEPATPPTQPHRQPPTQRGNPPHRPHPGPMAPTGASADCQTPRQRRWRPRSPPRPETPPLRRRLPGTQDRRRERAATRRLTEEQVKRTRTRDWWFIRGASRPGRA
jgi:hypothetical protein